MSLLSWERGLKLPQCTYCVNSGHVAPLVGAWIEIGEEREETVAWNVAPLVGAWIEIVVEEATKDLALSLLSWERGLKYQ